MYSKQAVEYKYIAEAFGHDCDDMTQDQISRLTLKEMEKFKSDFNVPKKLSDYGISEQDLDILALNAFEDACTASNPREVTMTDIYLLLKKML